MASAQKEHRGAQRQNSPAMNGTSFSVTRTAFGRPPRTQKSKSPANTTPASTRGTPMGTSTDDAAPVCAMVPMPERRKHTACGINFCAVPPERLLHIADRAGGVFRAEFCRQNALGIYGHHAEKCRNPHPDDRARAADQNCRRNTQNIPRCRASRQATPSRTEMRKIPRSAACRTMPRASCPAALSPA